SGNDLLISESTRAQITAPLRVDAQFTVEPKGAKGSVQLFQIGGLGPPFDLQLPVRSAELPPLLEPIPVNFTVLEEKFVGRTIQTGQLKALSESAGLLETGQPLAPLCNLKITVTATPLANTTGEIYAKVTGVSPSTPTDFRLRFTSVSPELKP